jgi:hypothetical protein
MVVKDLQMLYHECTKYRAFTRSIMSTVRINITLPKELSRELDSLVGPKKKSRFIADTLQKRIEEIHRAHMEALLEEGYKAGRDENLAMLKEFETIDIEGWDGY